MRVRKRNRLQGYDYSRNALYFVTSCTKNGIHHFGTIEKGKMIKNSWGEIAETQWLWLAQQYPYVILHQYVIMPNHMHGIIEINREALLPVQTGRDLSVRGDGAQENGSLPMPEGGRKIKSLSELMGAYKTTSSKQIHLSGNHGFAWHRSFYDHIIRTEEAYFRIAEYIETNPFRWKEDRFFENPLSNGEISE